MKEILETMIGGLIVGGFWGGIFGIYAFFVGKKNRKKKINQFGGVQMTESLTNEHKK